MLTKADSGTSGTEIVAFNTLTNYFNEALGVRSHISIYAVQWKEQLSITLA